MIYFTVEYDMASRTTVQEAAQALAIGQSIGNPNIRSQYETPEIIENNCARVESVEGSKVKIKFPLINLNLEQDGISHLLCMIQGGQLDIDIITRCRVMNIDISNFPKVQPKFGLSGIREYTKSYGRPLLGCIIKPKIGLKPKELSGIVSMMIEGGANIIKEDEILASPLFCRLEDRLPYIRDVIQDRNVVYLTCINADADRVFDKVRTVNEAGVNGIHFNFWGGLGNYRAIRKLNLPLVFHYQKSGDKILTGKDNPFGIEWHVLCKLAVLCGIDTIHAGMWGGYLNDDPIELKSIMDLLSSNNIVPALSCGMNAQVIPKVTEKFGVDYLANVGGAVHTNKDGIVAAVKELRNAIDHV
jgi:ribulose-bisphosphate carboxylase large chain